MVVDDDVGRERTGMFQRGERIAHFVKTELHVNNIAVYGNVPETGVKRLYGIVISVRGNFPLKFLESREVAVYGDESLLWNRRVKKMPVASADSKDRLVREVIEPTETPGEQCVVSSQP
jgi:hypothetical protein